MSYMYISRISPTPQHDSREQNTTLHINALTISVVIVVLDTKFLEHGVSQVLIGPLLVLPSPVTFILEDHDDGLSIRRRVRQITREGARAANKSSVGGQRKAKNGDEHHCHSPRARSDETMGVAHC